MPNIIYGIWGKTSVFRKWFFWEIGKKKTHWETFHCIKHQICAMINKQTMIIYHPPSQQTLFTSTNMRDFHRIKLKYSHYICKWNCWKFSLGDFVHVSVFLICTSYIAERSVKAGKKSMELNRNNCHHLFTIHVL